MRAEFKRDVSHNYLILQGDHPVDTSSYPVRMLAGNVIPCVLKCHLQNLDGTEFYYYDITSKQSIAVLYEDKKFQKEDLQIIFSGMVHVIEELTEYLMNPELLLFQPEYIYMDAESRNVYFCCLPGYQRDVQQQFRNLTEYILPKLQHEDPGAVELGYGIYRKSLEKEFQLEMIKAAVYQEPEITIEKPTGYEKSQEQRTEENAEEQPETDRYMKELQENTADKKFSGESDQKKNIWKWVLCIGTGVAVLLLLLGAGMLGVMPWIPIELVLGAGILALSAGSLLLWISEKNKRKKEEAALWRRKRNSVQERGFSEEFSNIMEKKKLPEQELKEEEEQEVLGETVVLSAGISQGPASLVSREPGELATIFLEQELTVVGKLINAADAVIPVSTVSRVHARIRKKEGGYYLADLNSRNGTAVNGRMLKADEEYLLQDEDQVDFAQARYIFVK